MNSKIRASVKTCHYFRLCSAWYNITLRIYHKTVTLKIHFRYIHASTHVCRHTISQQIITHGIERGISKLFYLNEERTSTPCIRNNNTCILSDLYILLLSSKSYVKYFTCRVQPILFKYIIWQIFIPVNLIFIKFKCVDTFRSVTLLYFQNLLYEVYMARIVKGVLV